MNCPSCGAPNIDGATYCNKCGASMDAAPEYAAGGAVRMGDGAQTAGKRGVSVMAILAFVFAFIIPPLGFILGLAATIIIAASKNKKRGLGLAIAAMPITFVGGIMAATAVPAFINYMNRSKASEATFNVDRCLDGVQAYYSDNETLPPSTGWTPASEPGDQKYLPSPAEWAAAPWPQIGFAMENPHFYRYRLTVSGAEFSCEAMGDLDGDGVKSFYQRTGQVLPDGRMEINPEIYKEAPLE